MGTVEHPNDSIQPLDVENAEIPISDGTTNITSTNETHKKSINMNNISFSDMTNKMEQRKTAIVSPLQQYKDVTKVFHCDECNFIGKTATGLKRHKERLHTLSDKEIEKSIESQVDSEPENISDENLIGNVSLMGIEDDDNEDESTSRDSSIASYPDSLSADYLKYIYF